MANWLQRNGHRLLAHLAGITALVVLAGEYLRDDPLMSRTVMLRSGSYGLLFLVASFACTPASLITGWRGLVQIRRPLGLYGFACIAIHLLVYAVLENGLEWELIVRDLEERRAMSVGLLGFALLVPLAITSTRWWQRKLGKRWRLLHRLIYFALPLSVLHFLLLDRDFLEVPIVYAIVVGLLLAIRLPPVRRIVVRLRHRLMALRAAS